MSEVRGIALEEMEIGLSAEAVRTVTEDDLDMFAKVSGDYNPVHMDCLLYTSPSPRDLSTSRMPSSA